MSIALEAGRGARAAPARDTVVARYERSRSASRRSETGSTSA